MTRLKAIALHRYTWWMAGAVNVRMTEHSLFLCLVGVCLFVALEITHENNRPGDSTREGDA